MQFRIYFYIHEAPKNDLFSVREKSKSWTVFTRYSNFHTGPWNSEAEYERHSASKFRKQVPKAGSQSRFPKQIPKGYMLSCNEADVHASNAVRLGQHATI